MVISEKKLREMIKESIQKSLIRESTYNRMLSQLEQYDTAILTAWRKKLADGTENTREFTHLDGTPMKDQDRFSKKEKKFYNKEMKAILLKKGYGVTKVRGSYKECDEPEDQEESYFVINKNNDPDFKENIIQIGEKYDQDSIMYSPKGSKQGIMIGTNNSDFPGYRNEVDQGGLKTNAQSIFMSRLGNRGFTFTNGRKIAKDDPNRVELLNSYDNNYENDDIKSSADRKKERIEKNKNLQESLFRALKIETYDDLSINTKRIVSEIAGKAMKRLDI